MADYNSSYTGVQIDTAVGKALTPDLTPTAESTALITSGAVKAAMDEKVPVYGMGENLLRNAYFLNPVNQRGQDSYTFSSGDYSIDGWKLYRGTMSVTANGLVWQWDGNSSYSPFHQNVDGYDRLIGQTVTISVLLGDGTLYKDTFVVPSTGIYTSSQYGQIRFYATASSKAIEIGKVLTTSTITLVAAKLELGSEQTLAHLENSSWVLNEFPNYEEELIKCQTSTADSTDTYANKTLANEKELATVESGTTASNNFAEGDLFTLDGVFCRAKTAISSGAALTLNTNYEETTVAKQFRSTKMFYLSQESGTTSSLGNLNLALNPNAIVVGFRPSQSQAVSFFGRGSNGNYFAHIVNSSGSNITNTAVTLDVYYILP
jgi:hypothetical protein